MNIGLILNSSDIADRVSSIIAFLNPCEIGQIFWHLIYVDKLSYGLEHRALIVM